MPANERQEGGNHWKSEYQHWDWVHDTTQDYFIGNATGYLSRHRLKNGAEDLRKCVHYIDKKQELSTPVARGVGGVSHTQPKAVDFDRLLRFAEANRLTGAEIRGLHLIITGQYDKAREVVQSLIAVETSQA
jgi:hypothetical protein